MGGVSLEVAGERLDDVRLGPSLEPFRVEADVPNVRLEIEWLPEFSWFAGTPRFDSGGTWRLYETGCGFRFDFVSPVFGDEPYKRLLMDETFSRAKLQMNQDCLRKSSLRANPLEYPLDELVVMHRLTQEAAIELHGVGIAGPDGASNLFVGHSGAGKSTTARLWTAHPDIDIHILSDDRIIVREHPVADGGSQIFMYGTPWHGEAHFALAQRSPLRCIFVLEHGKGNVVTPLGRSEAVAELFARAFVPFHRHEYVENALSFLERVADSIPCYRYSFEPDERAVQKVLQLDDSSDS